MIKPVSHTLKFFQPIRFAYTITNNVIWHSSSSLLSKKTNDLVIIIFLVVSTTFSKFSELKINLPIAEANQSKDKDDSINIIITEDGQYSINEKKIESVSLEKLVAELKAESNGKTDMPVIINADAMTTHQSVVDVMEASRLVGLNRITFSTKVK